MCLCLFCPISCVCVVVCLWASVWYKDCLIDWLIAQVGLTTTHNVQVVCRNDHSGSDGDRAPVETTQRGGVAREDLLQHVLHWNVVVFRILVPLSHVLLPLVRRISIPLHVRSTVTALGLVLPGSETEGVTPMFFLRKNWRPFFAHHRHFYWLIHSGVTVPPGECHPAPFYLSDLVCLLFFVNSPTIFFRSSVTPWRVSPGAVRPPPT